MAGYSDPADYLGGVLGSPVTLTSGYRSPQKNALVGGVPNSAHLTGQAYDFIPKGISTKDAADRLAKSGIPFDQVIDENDHVHISFAPTNRRQVIPSKMAKNVSDDDLLAVMGGSSASAGKPAGGDYFPAGDSRNSPAAVTVGSGQKNVTDDQLLSVMGGSSEAAGGGSAPPPAKAPGDKSSYMGKPFGFTEEVESHIPFAKDFAAGVPAALDAITGKGSLGANYRQNLSDYNAAQAGYEANNPAMSGVGTGLGILASGGPAGGAASAIPQTLGQLMKAGAKGGATLGALFGAGEAGDGAGGLGDRAKNTAVGAGVGALTGFGLPLAAKPVAMIGKAAGATLGAILQKVGVSATDHADVAANKLIQALNRDQIPAQDVADALRAAPSSKPVTALDVAGTNTNRVARNLVTTPGQAGDQVTAHLENRSADQTGRVLKDIKEHLSSNTDVYGLADNLAKERSTASTPLYKAAFDKPAVTTDRLKDFAADADIQAGMRTGIKLAKREALANGEKFVPSDYAITEFNSAGDPVIGPVPKWRTWQAAKEGLDQKIESYRNEITRQLPDTKEVRSLVNLKNSLLKELDAVNPDYKVARAAWGGPSQSKTSMRMGEDFLKADPEEIQKAYAGMSESDKDFYRIGAARAIQDKANSAADSADLSKRLFGNARIRSQIETVFGKGSADKFGAAMGHEGTMAKTKQFVLGGSNTANKFADAEDSHHVLAQEALHGGMAGGPKGAIIAPTIGAMKRGINNLFSGIHPEVANRLADALTASGEKGAAQFEKLGARQAARNASALKRQGVGRITNRLLSGAAAQGAVRSNQQ